MSKIKISNFLPIEYKVHFSFGPYQPVQIEFDYNKKNSGTILTWRLVSKLSLLHVSIEKEIMSFKHLDCIFYNDIVQKYKEEHYPIENKINNIPVIDQEIWPNSNFSEYKNTFLESQNLIIIESNNKDKIRLRLYDESISKGYRINENIIFEVNSNNEIVGINIQTDNLVNFENFFKQKSQQNVL